MKSNQWAMVNRRVDSGKCGRCGLKRPLKTTYHCESCAAMVSAENANRQRIKRAAITAAKGSRGSVSCGHCGAVGHNKRTCKVFWKGNQGE